MTIGPSRNNLSLKNNLRGEKTLKKQLIAVCGIIIAGIAVFADKADNKIVDAAEKYIASKTDSKEIQQTLKDYKGPIGPVITTLKEKEQKEEKIKTEPRKMEEFKYPPFTTEEFKKKFPAACLFYYLPEDYSPDKTYGLLVYMHGGGNRTLARQAGFYVTKYELDKRLKEAKTPYIIVAPSYNNKPNGINRWITANGDDFIDDVIKESKHRFNIDPNRIAVSGFSMGGSGAWRQAQRLNDIACAGAVIAGGWNIMNFEPFKLIPIYFIAGQYDGFVDQMAKYGGKGPAGMIPPEKRVQRKRDKNDTVIYTDDKLTEIGAPHVLKWHLGGHTLLEEAAPAVEEFAVWLKDQKRNTNPKEVYALTPRGAFCHIKGTRETPHTYWISILEKTGKPLLYYGINSQKTHGQWRPIAGETPETYAKRVKRIVVPYGRVKGAWVDAVNKGDNTFDVKTKNVKKFAIWLNDKMVDFSKPVVVNVNGKKKIFKNLKPTLIAALRSYKRRHDWELIYPCELIIDVP